MTANALAALAGRHGLQVETGADFLTLTTTALRARFIARALAAAGAAVELAPPQSEDGSLRLTAPAPDETAVAALAQLLQPDLLCLDVDGTLIDTRPSFDAAVIATVHAFTGDRPREAELQAVRNEGGFNDDHVLSRELIRRRGRELPLSQVAEAFNPHYFGGEGEPGLWRREKPLIRPEVWKRMRARLPLAFVTGRNRIECALAFEILNVPNDVPCANIDDVSRGKPDPEGIHLMMAHYGARRPWMVGDNVDDILAARAAGAVAIGVGAANGEALERAGAAVALADINLIEELL